MPQHKIKTFLNGKPCKGADRALIVGGEGGGDLRAAGHCLCSLQCRPPMLQLEAVLRIRIRIRIQLINFGADPDFYLMRMRIQVTKMMRILADPDPQHWVEEKFIYSSKGKLRWLTLHTLPPPPTASAASVVDPEWFSPDPNPSLLSRWPIRTLSLKQGQSK
jgi:hypothetical protein